MIACIRVFAAAAMLGVAACSSAATENGMGTTPRRQNVITQEEIAASGFANMQDAITRLRPQYLRGRGQSSLTQGQDIVAVYIDAVHLGGPNLLRTIPASSVLRVEFITGGDTSAKFGMNHAAGVIHIMTK